MEIKLYQQGLPENIPSADFPMISALSSRMIKDIPDAECYQIFKNEIAKCYISARFQSPEESEFGIIIDETMKSAKSMCGTLREKELAIAFNRGILKEYGDYHGLSTISFFQFIKSYIKEDTRIKLTQAPKTESQEPTIEERFQLAGYNALKALTGYSSGKDISLVAPTVYKFLGRLKIIQYSDEEKEQFISEAEKDVRNELSLRAKTSLDKHERNKILAAITNGHDLETKIILQAQRLGLYAYFQTCIIEEIDLKQTILNRKP